MKKNFNWKINSRRSVGKIICEHVKNWRIHKSTGLSFIIILIPQKLILFVSLGFRITHYLPTESSCYKQQNNFFLNSQWICCQKLFERYKLKKHTWRVFWARLDLLFLHLNWFVELTRFSFLVLVVVFWKVFFRKRKNYLVLQLWNR